MAYIQFARKSCKLDLWPSTHIQETRIICDHPHKSLPTLAEALS